MWRNEEMAEFIGWLREYNLARHLLGTGDHFLLAVRVRTQELGQAKRSLFLPLCAARQEVWLLTNHVWGGRADHPLTMSRLSAQRGCYLRHPA